VALGPAVFDRNIFLDGIARFRKSANEGLHVCGISSCRGSIEEADYRFRRLLGTRRERPPSYRPAEKPDEFASSHYRSRSPANANDGFQ